MLSSPEQVRARDYPDEPSTLLERVLNSFTSVGDAVLSPYIQTGNLVRVCQANGRKLIGTESDRRAHALLISTLDELATGDADRRLNEAFVRATAPKVNVSDLIKAYRPRENYFVSETAVIADCPESNTLEFKETLCWCIKERQKKSYIEQAVMKTIAAFLNTDGGTLLIGVRDDNSIRGIEEEINCVFQGSRDKFMLHFENILKRDLSEMVFPYVHEKPEHLLDRTVLRVDVERSSEPCYYGKEEKFYVRRNPKTAELTGRKMVNFISERFG